jgi:hypothetical protein
MRVLFIVGLNVSNISPVKEIFRCDECCHLLYRTSLVLRFTPRAKIRKYQISVKELIQILFHSSACIRH